MSQRRKAEIGLLSACLLMAGALTVLYRGSRDVSPPRGGVTVSQTQTTPSPALIKIAQAAR